jgi:SOS-response transcriptional repressor LexA
MALNPITFTEQVVSDFLRYQLTTYPLADADLHGQLRALLRVGEVRETPLRQGPFVSLSRPFRAGATIDRLVTDGVLHVGMTSIVPYDRVRAHQEQAMRAVVRGRTTLVATGTGSGKTESFLYPIISRCLALKEAGAPPGIVAVLVYPMNALAEDQLDRLRGLLAGHGIPFGMYVGKTPDEEAGVRGERMPQGSSNADYQARLEQMREAGDAATLLPAEERASRAAMRKEDGAPRILLTNVKQLELLLTRGKDIGLFANAPLEFLVFDEAHTFRGAQGAETAALIRRLRAFCGKSPSEVACIATSATMADPERGAHAASDFARRFFGVDSGSVELVGEVYDELRWNERRAVSALPTMGFPELLNRMLVAVDAPDEQVADALSACLVELGGARLPRRDWQSALASQLASNELVHRLAEILRAPRALSELPALLEPLAGREVTEHEILCWLALGVATGRGGHEPVLRPVVHSFIRGVGGAVVTLSKDKGAARLWLAGEEAETTLGESYRRFPIFTCTTCGQHYYETWVKDFRLASGRGGPEGGDQVDVSRVWEHLADELGGARALFVDRLVVQPDEDDDDEDLSEADALPAGHDFEHRRLHPMWVCAHCGALTDADSATCAACHTGGGLVAVQVVRSKDELPGVLHSCAACAAPGRRPGGGRYREPARPIRATSVSDVHVLAQSMLHLSERPRLLVFADNRQDAAFQAGWMRDHARRFRLRALMAQAIPAGGASVGDIAQSLDATLEADRELSRALIPEVWQVAPQEDAGTKHREERLYFLRLQVLRELATGVKQRLGLEPWGRLRVDYVGLDPEHGVIARWAARLGAAPEALTEGVAALLDHHRRIRVLHDAPTRLFGKVWRDGDKEVQYGYLPSFAAGPRGAKLSRLPADSPARVTQWVGTRPTQVWNAVGAWGLDEESLEQFLIDLWGMLKGTQLLLPVTLEGWGRPLPGSAGTYQVDSAKLRLTPHQGRYRCQKCRRTTVRRGPTSICLAWRCGGTLAWEESDPDDFDLHVLDGNYAMLRAAEHSAQVPADVRERIENQFKGQAEHVNTLVCTPTLELGVDIGALDAVLMRNVPPSAANYWQRAGRAGRRHRMAVDVTYAQATNFDLAYFRDPLKLLGGAVEPPRFNLKNALLVEKHVHASVLTALYGIARRASEGDRLQVDEVLGRCFPSTLRPYLFTPGGEVRSEVLDVTDLQALIQRHRDAVLREVQRAFRDSWPAEDADAVSDVRIAAIVDGMAQALAEVLQRFKRRLDWARGELSRLAREEAQKGVLDPEDQAHRRRCQRVIERLKGQAQRTRAQAQGGGDDSDTMGALAREGFLPGYGLESGSIIGTAEPPRMTQGLSEFDLPRAPTIALREYVPGNAIYANGFRFVPRRFQLSPDDTMRFRVDAAKQVVSELGVNDQTAALGAEELRAVPVCDVLLPSQSQISDEEDFRFQMPVAVYSLERGAHRGGKAWNWGELNLQGRRAVQLRMVNVGPKGEVGDGRVGYLLCLACGQSHSPYASARSKEEFQKKHLDRCNHRVESTGFFADVEVDALGLHDASDRTDAFSLIEALRMGAARVLDMEIDDLQITGIGHAGDDNVDVLLYDPMPGGSGLLEQLVLRWPEVRAAALALVDSCAGACERSCIDCLQTYRNRFYHQHLDRHRAKELLERGPSTLGELHPIPERLPHTATTVGQPQTVIEHRFKRFLLEAGLPAPEAQKKIQLGVGQYTVPDFFYAGDGPDEPGIAIFLDGMAGHIHGDPSNAERDRFLREKLRSLDYEVVEVRSFELDDRAAVVSAVAKIAKYLVGKNKQRAVREDVSWFERARSDKRASAGRVLRLTRASIQSAGAVPIVDLRVAAGPFSEGQMPTAIAYGVVEGTSARTGHFVAQVVGDSMNEVAPAGAWCLWEYLGAAGVAPAEPGQSLLVRRPDAFDPEFGEYTFKHLVEGPEGRYLAPRSTNPAHTRIPLSPRDDVRAVARFVSVLEASEESE